MASEQQQAKESWNQRLRRALLYVAFALVLLIPKALKLRRRRRLFNTFRFVLAILGALLFADKAGSPGSFFCGLLLIAAALLLRPEKEEKSVDRQARELGALVVLNGGCYQVGVGSPACRFFVSPERLHVLDARHRPLLEIPWSAISSVRAEPARGGWRLGIECNRVGWNRPVAEFHYHGFFAEHLARVAQATLCSRLHSELPLVGY